MHFGSKQKKSNKSCVTKDYIIEGVHTYRYLGFLLDQDLTFKADLKQTIRTILQKFYICLRKLNAFQQKHLNKMWLNLCFSHVLPIII